MLQLMLTVKYLNGLLDENLLQIPLNLMREYTKPLSFQNCS